MMKLIVILPILYFSFSIICTSQMTRKEKLIEYKKLGKEDLTRLAIEDMLQIEDENLKYWDLTAYKVQVLYNEKDLMVYFTLPNIVFLAINHSYYSNLYGDVLSDRFVMEVIANPSNYEGTPQFYKSFLDAEELFQVDFVLNAINTADKTSYTYQDYEGKMEIRENSKHYAVRMHFPSQIIYFKIEKETGRKYDERSRNISLKKKEYFIEIED